VGGDAHNHQEEHDDVPEGDKHPQEPEVAQQLKQLGLETVRGLLERVLLRRS
jgi:hypothetical protein